jgi:hypothetical protein
MMVRVTATDRAGDLVFEDTFGRPRFAGGEVGGKAIQRRAVRADDLVVVAEIEENMGMVERRVGAHAHELLRTDLDHRDAGIVVEVRDDMVGHLVHLRIAMTGGCNQCCAAARNAAHHTDGCN